MIDDDEFEAAQALYMMSLSVRPWTKQSVVDAIEREDRVFNRVLRRRRSFRIDITSSSSSTAIVEHVSKEDTNALTHNVPVMESPTKPTKNNKKRPRPPLFPPKGKQPKKAKRDLRLAAEASSSGTREPTPEWLLRLMRSKNGAEPKKIIDKDLTATDICPDHNRLSMPFSNIVDLEFLNPAEARIIREDARRKRKRGVDAKLVASDLREFVMSLRRWDMKKKSGRSYTPVYNLVKRWKKVVQDYGLKEKDKIQLWSFHSDDGQLYFALAPPPPKSEETSSASVII